MVNVGGPYLDYPGCIDAGRSENSTQPMHLWVHCHWLILLEVPTPRSTRRSRIESLFSVMNHKKSKRRANLFQESITAALQARDLKPVINKKEYAAFQDSLELKECSEAYLSWDE